MATELFELAIGPEAGEAGCLSSVMTTVWPALTARCAVSRQNSEQNAGYGFSSASLPDDIASQKAGDCATASHTDTIVSFSRHPERNPSTALLLISLSRLLTCAAGYLVDAAHG